MAHPADAQLDLLLRMSFVSFVAKFPKVRPRVHGRENHCNAAFPGRGSLGKKEEGIYKGEEMKAKRQHSSNTCRKQLVEWMAGEHARDRN
jgi:hypothetical protein